MKIEVEFLVALAILVFMIIIHNVYVIIIFVSITMKL